MKFIVSSTARYLLLFSAFSAGTILAADPSLPPRIKRSEAFLGIHFDFHATEAHQNIGGNTTPAMVNKIIDAVHPDYLQIDCKGHPGYSSYPTKVGNPAPGITVDSLKIWREVTAQRGVSLIMHYSGVVDAKAVQDHPDWVALNRSGKPENRATSLFGPYVDQLMIPQLRELATVYGVDGAWVDGECWGVAPDYSPAALEAFRKKTGIADAPRSADEKGWQEFMDFQRDAFRNYLRRYVSEIKKTSPDFQIASNWAFSDYMPEPVSASVDFLSGDSSATNSINAARVSARYLAGQGMPWDLMVWSFSRPPEDPSQRLQKTAVQLECEAAMIIALGGGFQAYYKQNRDGSIVEEEMAVMAEVAKFCRARQAFCHHATQVPQVALLLSTPGNYLRSKGPFSRDPAPYRNTLFQLLGEHYSVELLSEHRLTGRMTEYPLIVIPEWDQLAPGFKPELLAYVKAGGKLLLAGPKAARLFQNELTPSASVITLGKGTIEACDPANPAQFAAAAKRLFPNPIVELTGSSDVDVTVNRFGGKLAINLVNASGPHAVQPLIESIAPIGPLQVTIRQSATPSKITLQPAGTVVPFQTKEGKVELTIPQVAIHDILVVE